MCQSINVSSDQQIFFYQAIVSTDQCVIRPTKFFFNPTNVSTDQCGLLFTHKLIQQWYVSSKIKKIIVLGTFNNYAP